MEERGSQSRHDSTQDQQNIVLHVLSPSSEVPNKITFPIIHVSTTIGELKTRIREAIPTRPAPERQRLIYRGKALTQDATTLKDVFTQDIVCAISYSAVLQSDDINLDKQLRGPLLTSRSTTDHSLDTSACCAESNTESQ